MDGNAYFWPTSPRTGSRARQHTPAQGHTVSKRSAPLALCFRFLLICCADLCCVVVHCLLGCQIALVTHKELVHVLASAPVDLVEPLLHVVERIRICHIVHNDDAVRAAVIAAGNGPKPFLASGIPYLQLDRLAVQVDRADFLQPTAAVKARVSTRSRIRLSHP